MDSKKLPQLLPVKLATRHAGETVTFRVTAELKGEAREFDEEFHVALKAGPAMAWCVRALHAPAITLTEPMKKKSLPRALRTGILRLRTSM